MSWNICPTCLNVTKYLKSPLFGECCGQKDIEHFDIVISNTF